ncbi:MAG: aromatic-ring-hydroxylating dioxygenase subunit beta [Solirubrobacterales bacterium]
MEATAREPVRAGSQPYWDCVEFLVEEAAMLDENRLEEWLELLAPAISYRMPIRLTRERALGRGATVSAEGFHLYEDFDSLRTRVERLATDYAWAEDPPSRTRRFVSNFRVWRTEEDDLLVHSNLLLRRSHQDDVAAIVFSAERRDLLVFGDEGARLRDRLILLDHTLLDSPNLSLLF